MENETLKFIASNLDSILPIITTVLFAAVSTYFKIRDMNKSEALEVVTEQIENLIENKELKRNISVVMSARKPGVKKELDKSINGR